RSLRSRADRDHECVRRTRHHRRAALGRRPGLGDAAVSAGCPRRRRSISRERPRPARTQPDGDRAQPGARVSGRSRADPPPDRRGGARIQDSRAAGPTSRTPNRARATQENDMRITSRTTHLAATIAFSAALTAVGYASAQQPPSRGMAAPTALPPIPPTPPAPPVAPMFPVGPIGSAAPEDRADDLYDEGREAIEEGRYDRAVDRFNRLIELKTNRTDAALYWKAYAQNKLGHGGDAVTT